MSHATYIKCLYGILIGMVILMLATALCAEMGWTR
jgi:tetrahydromethanopterin S-methyltransferase subunit G